MEKRGRKPTSHKIENGIGLKFCGKCKEWKPLDDFNKNKKKKDGRSTWCKSCNILYYQQNSGTKKWMKIPNRVEDGVELKFCRKCQEWKPLDDFNKNKTLKGGRDSQCKACQSAINKANYPKVKERQAKTGKRWRDENKEHYSEYQKQYQEEHKDILAEKRLAKYAQTHPQKPDVRQCVDCKNYFPTDTLRKITYTKSAPKHICEECYTLRIKRQEDKKQKELIKEQKRLAKSIAQRLANQQRAETEKQTRLLNQQKAEERKQARLAYKQSDEYKAKKRKKKAEQAKQQRDRKKEQGIPNPLTQYYQKNPGKKRQHKLNRRAKEKGSFGSYDPQDWQYLLEITGFKCLKCGQTDCLLTHDHILLLGWGSNTITNLQPYCWSCNAKKGARYYDDSRTEEVKYLIYKRAFPNLVGMMEKEGTEKISLFFVPNFRGKSIENYF